LTVLEPRTAPPADYYRDNFQSVIHFIRDHHLEALHQEDRDWLVSWQSADVASQRLFVRLLMRKGPWVRTDRLQYVEVVNTADALEMLSRKKLVALNPDAPADQLLALLTIAELRSMFPVFAKRFAPKRKAEWLTGLLSSHTDTTLRSRIAAGIGWARVTAPHILDRFRLIYFGSTQADLSAFVLRDLGMMRYENYCLERANDQGALNRAGRLQLDRQLELNRIEQAFRALDVIDGLAEACRLQLAEPAEQRTVDRRRSRLLNTLGQWHERRDEPERALACYETSCRHPARERRVRLLSRAGRESEARTLLEAMRAHSWSVEEEIFTERFGIRGQGDPVNTDVRVLVDPQPELKAGAIEARALLDLEREGAWGVHLENVLPLMLTGLAFWEVIFAPIPGAFTHPFQSGPHDLWWDDFAKPREALINEASQRLGQSSSVSKLLLDRYDLKLGMACDLVHWRAIDRDLLQSILDVLPGTVLVSLITTVIQCPGRCRTGFPDLFVAWPSGDFAFVEVKGPTDQLQPQQRIWLRRLDAAGIPARVLRYKRQASAACAT
jgi:hypothetical protein